MKIFYFIEIVIIRLKKFKIIIKIEILLFNDIFLKLFYKKNYMLCFVVCVFVLFFICMFNDFFLNVRF